MEDVELIGSTATLSRIRTGVLLKSPHDGELRERSQLAFSVEEPILHRLGHHPRIVQ